MMNPIGHIGYSSTPGATLVMGWFWGMAKFN